MATISTFLRPVYTFGDEGLIEYEKIAAKKLQDIIELLDLGEGSNLQMAKQTYLPDAVAKIDYTVMEGITTPIILVEINRQPQDKKRLEKEEKEEQQREKRYYYVPSFWCGITTRNIEMGFFDGNNNCGYEGSPPEGRLCAFEPLFDDGQAYTLLDGPEEYGYTHTVESLPGYDCRNGIPSWASQREGQPGADVPRRTAIGATQGLYERGAALSDEGFFGDQDWCLEDGFGTIYGVFSEHRLMAFENGTCYLTTPRDALRPLFDTAFDPSVFPDDMLSEVFWHRSVICGSVTLGTTDVNEPEAGSIEYTITRPCTNIGEDPGLVGSENSITYNARWSGDTIGSVILPGEYEIHPWVMSFSCECMSCETVVRLVIGSRLAEFESIVGGPEGLVEWIPLMQIVDIELTELCQPGTQARFYFRDTGLGGYSSCVEDLSRGGLNRLTPGWWTNSIYVNPFTGGWRIDVPSYMTPFYDTPDCGPSPNDPPYASGCLGCTGDSSGCQGNICTDVPYCIKAGEGVMYDVRGLAAFHLARVVRVDANDGTICQVQLVGNDGGQGGSCTEKSFSYKTCGFASGIDPSIPLGSDLSNYPNQGIIGGWVVGELVAVIGYSNPCTTRCDGSLDYTGDFRWLVTKTKTPTDDFTGLFWQQFRCPNGIAFENYLNKLIATAKIQKDCGQLLPVPVDLKFEDGCLKRDTGGTGDESGGFIG